jgi:hypothetical protein
MRNAGSRLVSVERAPARPDYHYLRATYPLTQELMRTGLYKAIRDN